MESKESILQKMNTLGQILTEVRVFFEREEINSINESPPKEDLSIIVDTLQSENASLKNDVDQLHLILADKKDSETRLLEKLKAVEKELEESQSLLTKDGNNNQDVQRTLNSLQNENKELKGNLENATENLAKAELAKQDLKTSLDSLQKENDMLKSGVHLLRSNCNLQKSESEADERDDLIKELRDQLESQQAICKNAEDSKQELEELRKKVKNRGVSIKQLQDHLTSQKKNHQAKMQSMSENLAAIRAKLEASKPEFEAIKRDLNETANQVKNRDISIRELKDQLASQKHVHEAKIQSMSDSHATICMKLDVAKQKLDELRLKSEAIDQHFTADKVKKLIAQVNVHMNNGDVELAIGAFITYIFNTNLITNFNLVQIFHKVCSIKEQLNTLEEKLSNTDDLNSINSAYNNLKNNSEYPNLILHVEKKLLAFYYKTKLNITALSLCSTIISIRKCNDPWVYRVRGELHMIRKNYYSAREAFFNSLKFSKVGDPDLKALYDLAYKALELEVNENYWSIFQKNSFGSALKQNELEKRYKELIRYYHPDKQHGVVKEYKDIAECMSKELTQAYRHLHLKTKY